MKMKLLKITREMREKMRDRYPIICVPLWYLPTEPIDQSPPFTKEHCPVCDNLMWVSRKKRELIANQPNMYFLICGECLVIIHKAQGAKSPDEFEMIRIDESGGIQ